MSDLSPKRLQQHIDALDAFRRAYVAFLEGEGEGDAKLRAVVHDAIPGAETATQLAGVPIGAQDPPQMPNPQQYHGLHAVAFIHEQPGFRDLRALYGAPEMYERVIDHVDHAKARLAQRKQMAKAKRRRPTYWADRVVRGVLAIPAYIVSRIVGVPVAKIDRSAFGLPLRMLGVVADGLAVYYGLHALGLW